MSNKYSARSLPSVNRDKSLVENQSENSEWYNSFVENLQKNSVQSQRSIYEDISAIIGNTKPKYSSVEEAVKDLRERTGLNAFLKVKASLQEPEVFKKIPEMKVFIDNFVADHPGTSVESVVHDLLKLDNIREQLPDKTDVSHDVRTYINGKLAEIGTHSSDFNQVDMHVGKVDQSTPASSDDPLAICEPLKQNI